MVASCASPGTPGIRARMFKDAVVPVKVMMVSLSQRGSGSMFHLVRVIAAGPACGPWPFMRAVMLYYGNTIILAG